jgi:hypothetical protein
MMKKAPPRYLTRYYVESANVNVKNQLMKTPMVRAFDCMISAM